LIGELSRRLANKPGKQKALVAALHPGHRLAPARESDRSLPSLGVGFSAARVNTNRKIRNFVHQLETLGQRVTLAPAT
jgi:hypothetical protein